VLERRTLVTGVVALVPLAMEAAGFLVAFTERTGGTSKGRYQSLNLALRDGDDLDRVVENRRRVAGGLGVESFACAQQTHGARRTRIGSARSGAGFLDRAAAVPDTDCLETKTAGLALAIFTADCVPVALADPAAGTLTLVHAGWRGIAAGIMPAALGAFPDTARIKAAVGPAVGPDHYEIGEEVAHAVSSAAAGRAMTERRRGGLWLDLPGTVAGILEGLGVRSIERSEDCTACEPVRFFSHRRDGETGRQGMIALRLG
jgi:YfiH family protein